MICLNVPTDENMITSLQISNQTGIDHRRVLSAIRIWKIKATEGSYISDQNKILPLFHLAAPDAIAFLAATSKGKKVAYKLISATADSLAQIIKAISEMDIDCEDMKLYIARESITGNIKLGISKNPEARIKQLQTGNSSTLELLGVMDAPNGFMDESKIHKTLAANLIRGEWFSPESIKKLEKIND